jgi:hypothetical protein
VQAPEVPENATEDEFGQEECVEPLGPFPGDFVNIRKVRPVNLDARLRRGGSRGSFESRCGTNAEKHHNPDNFIVAPGVRNGAHHTHDYVGNVSADANSTNESLAAADTTCRAGDLSTYYWPVIRVRAAEGTEEVIDEENPHNAGTIAAPSRVQLRFRGNPTGRVVAMPEFIRVITGDAKASTNGGANANAKWTCTGFTNRITTKYPLCPRGSAVQRILDFPSCWDGENTDSANHRDHIAFPDPNTGACPTGTQAVPQLRISITYDIPTDIQQKGQYQLDAFPEENHNPASDHNDFANVNSDQTMTAITDCINTGRTCT